MIFLPYGLLPVFSISLYHFPRVDGLKLTIVIATSRPPDRAKTRVARGIEKWHRENMAFDTGGLQIGEKSNGGFPEVSMLSNGAFPRGSSLN